MITHDELRAIFYHEFRKRVRSVRISIDRSDHKIVWSLLSQNPDGSSICGVELHLPRYLTLADADICRDIAGKFAVQILDNRKVKFSLEKTYLFIDAHKYKQ